MVMIVLGILALAYGGFSYTRREKVLDIGPLQASVDRTKTVPIAPIAGIAAVAAGTVLVLVGSKARA